MKSNGLAEIIIKTMEMASIGNLDKIFQPFFTTKTTGQERIGFITEL
jgi:hypothetical protein